jgi:branched-chain amino acid aminotransferase
LLTPPSDAGILEGITRNSVIELAHQLGIPFAERTLVRHDVYVSDECFLTGSAAEVISVTKIDGRPIGDGKPGPITLRLGEAFKKLVHGS